MYIYERPEWPHVTWQRERLEPLLGAVRHQQGRVLGHMEALGFSAQAQATLQTLTLDVLKSSEIEGEVLPADQVRSSLARRLGLDMGGLVPAERRVEGVVEMLLDATQEFGLPLTAERVYGWQAALFPAGRNGLQNAAFDRSRAMRRPEHGRWGWRLGQGSPIGDMAGPMIRLPGSQPLRTARSALRAMPQAACWCCAGIGLQTHDSHHATAVIKPVIPPR